MINDDGKIGRNPLNPNKNRKPTKGKCVIVKHGSKTEKVPEPEIGIYPCRGELIPDRWYPNNPRNPAPEGQDGFIFDERSACWHKEEDAYDAVGYLEDLIEANNYDPFTAIRKYEGADD
jgi:hypothetical protein